MVSQARFNDGKKCIKDHFCVALDLAQDSLELGEMNSGFTQNVRKIYVKFKQNVQRIIHKIILQISCQDLPNKTSCSLGN